MDVVQEESTGGEIGSSFTLEVRQKIQRKISARLPLVLTVGSL